jgi:hypothetical protein
VKIVGVLAGIPTDNLLSMIYVARFINTFLCFRENEFYSKLSHFHMIVYGHCCDLLIGGMIFTEAWVILILLETIPQSHFHFLDAYHWKFQHGKEILTSEIGTTPYSANRWILEKLALAQLVSKAFVFIKSEYSVQLSQITHLLILYGAKLIQDKTWHRVPDPF